MKIKRYIWIALLPLLAAGCVKEPFSGEGAFSDGLVHFAAVSAPHPEGVTATKTVYSGELVTAADGNTYERIDWVTDGSLTDKIRIMCQQGSTTQGHNYADYIIRPASNTNASGHKDSEASMAEMNPLNDGFLFGTASNTTHHFLGFYPSPERSGAQAAMSSFTLSNATTGSITATIPAEQSILQRQDHLTGGIPYVEYMPDMNYAYMYAAAVVQGKDMAERYVQLRFRPLFTALRFDIQSADNTVQGYKLKSATLISKDRTTATATDLAGTFSGTFTADAATGLTGDFVMGSTSETSRSIYIHIPEAQRSTLDDGRHIILTFLALPTELTGLTLDLCFDAPLLGEVHKKIDLVNDADKLDWVKVAARNKLYARVGVANYYFQVEQLKRDKFLYDGSTQNNYYRITSYKKVGDEEPVAWGWEAVEYFQGGQWKPVANAGLPTLAWLTQYLGTNIVSGSTLTSDALVNYSDVTSTYNTAENPNWDLSRTSNTEAEAVNLACHDIYGNFKGGTDAVPYETANCYVVDGPGWYKFPAVYGNAYKQGAPNPLSYTSPDQSAPNSILKVFVNAKGVGITSPWITDQHTLSATKPAGLVWEDRQGMIDQVVYDPSTRYIKFHVNSNAASLHPGNALIGLFDEEGICWSWHIWLVTEADDYLGTLPVWYYTDADAGHSHLSYNDMLSKNLGYTDGDESVPERSILIRFRQKNSGLTGVVSVVQEGRWIDSGACYYQWGRKDPMFAGFGTKSKTVYIYYPDSEVRNDKAVPFTYDRGLKNSIRKPYHLLSYYSIQESWLGNSEGPWMNLWNTTVVETVPTSTNVQEYHLDEPVTKTVYDPCPPGFKVPNEFAFTGFSTAPLGAIPRVSHGYTSAPIVPGLFNPREDMGINFYINPADKGAGTIYFPFLGRRYGRSDDNNGYVVGELDTNAVYAYGIYWTAASYPYKGNQNPTYPYRYARTFYLNEGSTYPSYSFHNLTNYDYGGILKPGAAYRSGFESGHALQVRPVADTPQSMIRLVFSATMDWSKLDSGIKIYY